MALTELQDKLHSIGGRDLSSYGLLQPQTVLVVLERLSREYSRETNYSIVDQEASAESNEPLLTEDQRDVYNYFIGIIEQGEGAFVFVDAPGGTGKTFLINLILAIL